MIVCMIGSSGAYSGMGTSAQNTQILSGLKCTFGTYRVRVTSFCPGMDVVLVYCNSISIVQEHDISHLSCAPSIAD